MQTSQLLYVLIRWIKSIILSKSEILSPLFAFNFHRPLILSLIREGWGENTILHLRASGMWAGRINSLMENNKEKMFPTRVAGQELNRDKKTGIERVQSSCQYLSADLWVPRASSTLPLRRDITATFHQPYLPAINNANAHYSSTFSVI